ncbi:MAG: hypothetical protein R3F65_22665 [bacterium]
MKTRWLLCAAIVFAAGCVDDSEPETDPTDARASDGAIDAAPDPIDAGDGLDAIVDEDIGGGRDMTAEDSLVIIEGDILADEDDMRLEDALVIIEGDILAPEPEDMAVEPIDPDEGIEPIDPDMAVEPPEPDMMVDDRLFSFFVTSLQAMRTLSGSQDGFGGDLGGLEGADAICQIIAGGVGMGHKQWRAFLSATRGPDGQPVHAIERIGQGPWYDANGRLVSQNIQGLLQARPAGDPQTVNDLPDEFGVPLSTLGDSHDIMTGSNRQGRLNNNALASTCNDWTSANGNIGGNQLMAGHSWPRSPRNGTQWISDHTLRGCAPGVNLIQNGGGVGNCVGCSGGYGAIYCFALTP